MGGAQPSEPRGWPDAADCRALCDPERLNALAEAGLDVDADPDMEYIAERVGRWLDVPVALVSLVQADQQVFPGLVGLPEPWASKRSTPLSHSFCQHVVMSARPLIVSDARVHPLVRDNAAVTELGVVGYAGMPLTDAAGNVLGSLCAIDTAPRTWSDSELEALRDLARACSGELRLRLARYDADRERRRRDELELQLRRSFERSQALLRAATDFTDATTVEQVRERVGELVAGDLRPGYVGLAMVDGPGRMRRLHDRRFAGSDQRWMTFDVTAPVPSARAVRENRILHYPDRPSFDADHPEPVRQFARDLGLHAVTAAPLVTVEGPIGAILLGWPTPQVLEPADLISITSIAGYAAQALARTYYAQHRSEVAAEMQQAMLTTLPVVTGLEMAARYQSADVREKVGGDWYDVALTPDPGHPDRHTLTVGVGDVIGHNVAAATIMGQIRSMLRQSAWDHPGRPPSRVFSAFEQASIGLGIGATGTAVLAQLRRRPAGGWAMTWTNAGHPPPIVLTGDGATLLTEHDVLFGFRGLTTRPRRDHQLDIAPGSTLLLYTDGLIERRERDLDAGVQQLIDLLEADRQRPPQELVDLAVATLGRDSPDDVVALAIRFGTAGSN
jgi:Stage II sporulation protein E (SpoIIE)/GAF domain